MPLRALSNWARWRRLGPSAVHWQQADDQSQRGDDKAAQRGSTAAANTRWRRRRNCIVAGGQACSATHRLIEPGGTATRRLRMHWRQRYGPTAVIMR